MSIEIARLKRQLAEWDKKADYLLLKNIWMSLASKLPDGHSA